MTQIFWAKENKWVGPERTFLQPLSYAFEGGAMKDCKGIATPADTDKDGLISFQELGRSEVSFIGLLDSGCVYRREGRSVGEVLGQIAKENKEREAENRAGLQHAARLFQRAHEDRILTRGTVPLVLTGLFTVILGTITGSCSKDLFPSSPHFHLRRGFVRYGVTGLLWGLGLLIVGPVFAMAVSRWTSVDKRYPDLHQRH